MSEKDYSQVKWRQQVQKHLSSIRLEDSARASLKQSLLNQNLFVSSARPMPPQKPLWQRLHLDYIAVAIVSAAAVLFLKTSTNSQTDISETVTDLISVPVQRAYPADFDLEGDASNLAVIVKDVFPADAEPPFQGKIPHHLTSKFTPSEGRFFTWAGEPGVSIKLTANANAERKNPSAMLYIVKLEGFAEQRFPHAEMKKSFPTRSGKERLVQLWRDGNYGYALVHAASSSGTSSEFNE